MNDKYISKSINDTIQYGKKLAQSLQGNEVIFLYGPLGAGKTHFVKGLALGLGFSGNVFSPTFNILNIYDGEKNLHHFDMYRIEGLDALYGTGFFDYAGEHPVCVEWSENIDNFYTGKKISVYISYTQNEQEREIVIC